MNYTEMEAKVGKTNTINSSNYKPNDIPRSERRQTMNLGEPPPP